MAPDVKEEVPSYEVPNFQYNGNGGTSHQDFE